MGQRIVGQQKSRLVLCPLPFYWCHLLMAQTVERTAYAQKAEGTLRVGTVEGEFHIPLLVTGQQASVQACTTSASSPAALSKSRFLSHCKTLHSSNSTRLNSILLAQGLLNLLLILYPRLSQPMRQSGPMGALRTVLYSIDAEN